MPLPVSHEDVSPVPDPVSDIDDASDASAPPSEPIFDAAELAARSAELEGASPEDIVAFALRAYAPRVAISTAFGVEGCALIHMAVRIDPAVRVFTVDTDFLFEETQALKQRFIDRYGIELQTFKSRLTVEQQEAEHGPALYQRDPDLCCSLRKVEPTRRALAGLDCWLAGLRRDQGSSTRQGIQILERYDHEDGSPLIKVHPLANWSRSDTWRYVLDNEVPYNPLLDQGYKSIGCWPCTKAVDADDGERAGRWGGRKAECGIHTFMIRRDS